MSLDKEQRAKLEEVREAMSKLSPKEQEQMKAFLKTLMDRKDKRAKKQK